MEQEDLIYTKVQVHLLLSMLIKLFEINSLTNQEPMQVF